MCVILVLIAPNLVDLANTHVVHILYDYVELQIEPSLANHTDYRLITSFIAASSGHILSARVSNKALERLLGWI